MEVRLAFGNLNVTILKVKALIFKFRFIRIKRHYWGQSYGYDIADYFLKPYLQPKKKLFQMNKQNVIKQTISEK
jgi:hypothetical protein